MDLAAVAGLHLDPWQKLVLEGALGETQQGKWSAFHVALVVPRQNGKGSILEARELAGLFLFGERLIIHSAHEQITASEHFLRMLQLIEGTPEFSRRCMKPVHGKGSEAIRLHTGERMLFKTRTAGGGRGLTGDLVVLDEAMILSESTMNALLPTMAARSKRGNPQLWYAGSAVDQENPKHDGIALARVRARALEGRKRHAYFDWSIDADHPDKVTEDVAADPQAWAESNPGLGIRITPEFIDDERAGLGARGFAVERLGVGDWPAIDASALQVLRMWPTLIDHASAIQGKLGMSVDTSLDRTSTVISVAGKRADGRLHVEVIDERPGTDWVVDAAEGYVKRHRPKLLAIDGGGPANSFIPELKARRVEVHSMTARETAQAFGMIVDAATNDQLRHLGTPELAEAARIAVKRTVSDAAAWSRKDSGGDIAPLISCTNALWAILSQRSNGSMVLNLEEVE